MIKVEVDEDLIEVSIRGLDKKGIREEAKAKELSVEDYIKGVIETGRGM